MVKVCFITRHESGMICQEQNGWLRCFIKRHESGRILGYVKNRIDSQGYHKT